MKLPTFRRLNIANFAEEYRELIDTLSNSINTAIDSIHNALNNKLSLADNFLCDLKDIEISVDSSGIPTSTTTFKLSKLPT
jgi:hypothetical protein